VGFVVGFATNNEAHQGRDGRLHQDSDVVTRARGYMPSMPENPQSAQASAVYRVAQSSMSEMIP
jgi:hypothetical protein